jgi:ribonuclease M5
MIYTDTLFVVEGVTDVQFLSTFIQGEFVTTNGSDVPNTTILFIKKCQELGKSIIILTDPDGPGASIRQKLDQSIPNLFHAHVPKHQALKGHKVGIAQSTPSAVLQAIENKIHHKQITEASITLTELIDLALIACPQANQRRAFIAEQFHLGQVNGKTLLKRLNYLAITKPMLLKSLQNHETSPRH